MNAKETINFLKPKGGFKTVIQTRGAKIVLRTKFHGRYLKTLTAESCVLSEDADTGAKILLRLEQVRCREEGSDFGVSDDALLINPGCLTLSLNVDGGFLGLITDLELGKVMTPEELRDAIQQEHKDILRQVAKALADEKNSQTLQRIVKLHFPSEPDPASRFSDIGDADVLQGGACSPK